QLRFRKVSAAARRASAAALFRVAGAEAPEDLGICSGLENSQRRSRSDSEARPGEFRRNPVGSWPPGLGREFSNYPGEVSCREHPGPEQVKATCYLAAARPRGTSRSLTRRLGRSVILRIHCAKAGEDSSTRYASTSGSSYVLIF